MTLEAKLNKLHSCVTGYRELFRFEDTFGATFEEMNDITPMSRAVTRILAEVEYAVRLSKALNGKHNDTVDKTLDYLLDRVENDGNLTNSVCDEAEKMLMPLANDAKEYELILCGHAHIDMNWMWSHNETVAATVATFSTMLDVMDEYPEFCFSQSQVSVYEIIDKYAPELHDRIKQRIDEGRWEVTASAWVETDKNMPSTESLLRHIKYSKNYMRDKWGINPDDLEVDFSPDTFGHSANLPEINTFGGVKYYYHCRCLKEPYALYRWRGQSGKEVLMYREQHWYNSAITPKIGTAIFDIAERSAGFKTGLIIYGVGDHGGGPTRRDVNRAIDMMSWPIFPKIKFGTLREYFKKAESVWDKLPVVDHEINFLLTGCLTTESRIKYGNRISERVLGDAETMSALAMINAGRKMNSDNIEKAWQNVLFTHFHDILTGSCMQDTREHAMGLYQDSISYANTEFSLALKALSDNTDTSWAKLTYDTDSQAPGAGPGYPTMSLGGRGIEERGSGLTRLYNVYNTIAVDKAETVEITVWDWPGDLRHISLKNSKGEDVKFQLLDYKKEKFWDHRYFRILAYVELEALSCETLVLTQSARDVNHLYLQGYHVEQPRKNYILENDYIKAEINYSNGEIISLYDKKSDCELIKKCEGVGLIVVDTDRHSSSAYSVGTYFKRHKLDALQSMSKSLTGELKNEVSFDIAFRSSKIKVKYSLEKNSRFVRCNIEADWCEIGGDNIPVLIYSVPLAYKAQNYMYNIPAGTIIRPVADMETPGLSFAQALGNGRANLGIISDCKYAYRGLESELISTLINTAVAPDKYPERSVHQINLAIGVFDGTELGAQKDAESITHPYAYVSAKSHNGSIKPNESFVKVDADTAMLSAIYEENGMYAVRMYSVCDKEGSVKLAFNKPVKSAYMCNLMGEKVDSNVKIDNGFVLFDIGAKEVKTVKVKFE